MHDVTHIVGSPSRQSVGYCVPMYESRVPLATGRPARRSEHDPDKEILIRNTAYTGHITNSAAVGNNPHDVSPGIRFNIFLAVYVSA